MYNIIIKGHPFREGELHMIKVIITENYDEMSDKAAEIVKDVVKANPNAVLGLATGSSPIGLYKNLIKYNKEGVISFKNVKTVNLDEYVGLGAESDQSYVYFMNYNLFDHVDIDKANTNLPNGKAADTDKECERYTNLLKSMPQDIQVLGIGSNGHIGFNEPGTPFDSHTHIVNLTENTIKDNSRLFERIEDVPRQALTMGILDVMQAKKVILVANGENKAKAVYGMVKGEITPNCPASVLQNHPDCILVCDKAAAKLL